MPFFTTFMASYLAFVAPFLRSWTVVCQGYSVFILNVCKGDPVISRASASDRVPWVVLPVDEEVVRFGHGGWPSWPTAQVVVLEVLNKLAVPGSV